MKITKLRLIGQHTINLPIVGITPANDFICKGVDGLGPVEVNVDISRDRNGFGTYQGRQPGPREIVARVGLNAAWSMGQTPDSLRTLLYGLLSPGIDKSIMVQLMNGSDVVAQTKAYVKRIEPVLFSKEPEVQIVMPCLQSFLEHPNYVDLAATNLDRALPHILNTGTADAGIHMQMNFTGAQDSFYLHRVGMEESDSYGLYIQHEIQVADWLVIDTTAGKKELYLTRGGQTIPLVGYLHEASRWIELNPGLNVLSTSTQDFFFGAVYYTPLYWGI